MTLSVRLDDETKKLLTKLARARRTSRSAVVRQAIHAFANNGQQKEELSLYDRIKHIIDKVPPSADVPRDLSERHSEYFYEYLLEKKRKGRL